MHWEEEGWKPYRGPRKPEGLLEVMRAAYLAYGLAQGGSEQAAAAVEAETASFETLVKQLEADGPPDAREMAELAAYGMAKENAATKELVTPSLAPSLALTVTLALTLALTLAPTRCARCMTVATRCGRRCASAAVGPPCPARRHGACYGRSHSSCRWSLWGHRSMRRGRIRARRQPSCASRISRLCAPR